MEKGALQHEEEGQTIVQQLIEFYGFSAPVIELMQVSTENALYRIIAGNETWILKLFKASGSHLASRVVEHTRYEAQLVRALLDNGIATASIRPMVNGELVSTIEGHPALLFSELTGTVVHRTDCPLERVVSALAQIHTTQLERPLGVDTEFHFDDACMIWLPAFHSYRFDTSIDTELTSVLNRFAPLVEELNAGERREILFARSPSMHCHGDLSPGNMILETNGMVRIFDFNHTYYGPRLADVIDGAFQFHLSDYADFDAFLNSYMQAASLSDDELADLPDWIALVGILWLAKEVKVLMDPLMESQHEHRRERLHGISAILSRCL